MGIFAALSARPLGLAAAEDDTASASAALVVRLHGLDPDAFRELFERHAPAVRRFLKDLLRDDAAADEATQETFVRAHRRVSSLRESQKLVAWLLGIARNVAFESARARRAAPSLCVSTLEDSVPSGLLHAVLEAPSPETLLLGAETEKLLARALDELAPHRRAALLLRLDHGLAYEDIAQTLGWSLQKVKNEIHRARLSLRATLAPHLGVPP